MLIPTLLYTIPVLFLSICLIVFSFRKYWQAGHPGGRGSALDAHYLGPGGRPADRVLRNNPRRGDCKAGRPTGDGKWRPGSNAVKLDHSQWQIGSPSLKHNMLFVLNQRGGENYASQAVLMIPSPSPIATGLPQRHAAIHCPYRVLCYGVRHGLGG